MDPEAVQVRGTALQDEVHRLTSPFEIAGLLFARGR